MANWLLSIDISKEMSELNDFCLDFDETDVLSGDEETKYMDLINQLSKKFESYEADIKRVTDDDGTFESICDDLEGMMFAETLEDSNYYMGNIYDYCDFAKIWLEQIYWKQI